MAQPTRRIFAGTLLASATAEFLEPVRAAAAGTKPVRITGVDAFRLDIPTKGTPLEDVTKGRPNRASVVKVETDAGVRGYSFGGTQADLDRVVRPMLVGRDLFAIDPLLKDGGRGISLGSVGGTLTTSNFASIGFGAVEHALWDAIGKIAGLPVHRLVGGYNAITAIKAYPTYVWPGRSDQTQVSYKQMADLSLKVKKAGYKGIKFRCWRPNPMDDVDACGEISAAVGPDFAIMWDRTADWAGWVWDYETALKVCRGMEKNHAYWVEEPFARTDLLSAKRLRQEVDIFITGGNGIVSLDEAREMLVAEAFDIVQPDAVAAGGILPNVKLGHLCEAFHTPVTLHGAMGLRLDAPLQISSAIGAPWQEFALVNPPLLPEEEWMAAAKVLDRKETFVVKDGEIQIPQGPGLGMDVNEEAIEQYRAASEPRPAHP